ncbi:MAG: hypothetical protein A49_17280 [Methyloceanibacter sp.]|nr:MAG: hypothetical protein A49_17280 [Methyloceanibacter sp.]
MTDLGDRRIILLIDHLDDLMDIESRRINNPDLHDALERVLSETSHRVKVIVTSRTPPIAVPTTQESRWMLLDLREGLPPSEAQQLLATLDLDGSVGLRDADPTVLTELSRRTLGNPRALEALYRLLRRDFAISPADILQDDQHFLPASVLDVLIGEAYEALDQPAKIVMQVLSASERPLTAEAVSWVSQSYIRDKPPLEILNRLVNMQLVQRVTCCYRLRDADRHYVASQLITDSTVMERYRNDRLNRFELFRQHAEYLTNGCGSDQGLQGAQSLETQLQQFEYWYQACEYAEAARLLRNEIEPALSSQGRYRDLTRYYEHLENRLDDPELRRNRFDALARLYHRLGALDNAIRNYHEGLNLVRRDGDRNAECLYLANLAICKQEAGDLVHSSLCNLQALRLARQLGDAAREAHIWNIVSDTLAYLGQIDRAIQVSEWALALARKHFSRIWRQVEVVAKLNLGQRYSALGRAQQAQDECERAVRIAQSIGYQLGESAARRNLGAVWLDEGHFHQAAVVLREAVQLSDVTQSVQLQQTSRTELATALLLTGSPIEAEATMNEAVTYHTPLFDHEAYLVLGIIRLQQGKDREAAESFHQVLKLTEQLLRSSSHLYRALDTMGLTYCGLALAEQTSDYDREAVLAYEAGADYQGARHRTTPSCSF